MDGIRRHHLDEDPLPVGASILLCAGIPVPVTIPAGKRCFAWLIHVGDAGWILTQAATQA